MTLSPHAISWVFLVVQLLALTSMVALRLCASDRSRLACQRLFVIMLLAMGVVSVLAMGGGSDFWMTSGATLSIMTVCTSLDCRGENAGSAAY